MPERNRGFSRETEGEEVAYAGQTASLHYSEKAIDSPGEAKSDIDVIAGVAEKLGLGEYFANLTV